MREKCTSWQRSATCCIFMEGQPATVCAHFPAAPRIPPRPAPLSSLTTADRCVWAGAGQVQDRSQLSDELWRYSTTNGTWKLLESQGAKPKASQNVAMAAVGDVLYLHCDSIIQDGVDELWRYSTMSATWELMLTPEGTPGARHRHAMAAVGDVLYLHGGYTTRLGGLLHYLCIHNKCLIHN